MDYSYDPYTPSTPLYSGSQSPLKVPPTGTVPYPCVPSSSSSEPSQPAGLETLLPPQTQANVNDGSIFGLERDMCRDFLNAADNLGYALRCLSNPISNDPRHQALRARFQAKADAARAVISTQSENVKQMITVISTMNDDELLDFINERQN